MDHFNNMIVTCAAFNSRVLCIDDPAVLAAQLAEREHSQLSTAIPHTRSPLLDSKATLSPSSMLPKCPIPLSSCDLMPLSDKTTAWFSAARHTAAQQVVTSRRRSSASCFEIPAYSFFFVFFVLFCFRRVATNFIGALAPSTALVVECGTEKPLSHHTEGCFPMMCNAAFRAVCVQIVPSHTFVSSPLVSPSTSHHI